MEKLELYSPKIEDLWFKKLLNEDPKTMDYNRGYDLDFEGYNRNDGTIKTDIKYLKEKRSKIYINNKPFKYYYFIEFNDKFIGDIYSKLNKEINSYEIGIVILGDYRGLHLATPSIKLLCEILKEEGVKNLYHELPDSRKSALKADLNNGFKIVKENYKDSLKKFDKFENLVYLEKIL